MNETHLGRWVSFEPTLDLAETLAVLREIEGERRRLVEHVPCRPDEERVGALSAGIGREPPYEGIWVAVHDEAARRTDTYFIAESEFVGGAAARGTVVLTGVERSVVVEPTRRRLSGSAASPRD